MKQLLNRPFLLALILSLPLWVVFGNYVVALIAALLLSFLLSMYNSLRILNRRKADEGPAGPEDTE
ncbi:hypothetical protein H0A73_01595 [Alcaligenaceae bacterium]|nr:hypothetical protein [Alcaligenaceae bacterium]